MAKPQLTVDTYTGKLSRLKEDDLKLLGVSGLDVLDELEPFGDSTNDFIEFHIYDLEDNYLSSGKTLSIPSGGKIDVGAHLRGAGYERGDYKVVYNFLRRAGGSWNPVLVKKLNKKIYSSSKPRWIDTNGKIYAGRTGDTEVELLVKDYKYFLQEISPSRTEVRLAVNPGIDDSDYLEEFRLMGYTCLSFTDRAGTAKIDGTGRKVTILNRKWWRRGKSLIQKMVGGKLVIRDALVIGHDVIDEETETYRPLKEILPMPDGTQNQISGLIEFANDETLVATLNSDDAGFVPRMRDGEIIIKDAIKRVAAPRAHFTYTTKGTKAPAPPQVKIYSQYNFKGGVLKLGAGTHKLNLIQNGIFDNNVKSMIVPKGYKVTFWQHPYKSSGWSQPFGKTRYNKQGVLNKTTRWKIVPPTLQDVSMIIVERGSAKTYSAKPEEDVKTYTLTLKKDIDNVVHPLDFIFARFIKGDSAFAKRTRAPLVKQVGTITQGVEGRSGSWKSSTRTYDEQSMVTIKAVPNNKISGGGGRRPKFVKWVGDIDGIKSTTASQTYLKMNGNKTITAIFHYPNMMDHI